MMFMRGRILSLITLLAILGGCSKEDPTRFCQGDGLCVEPDGQKVLPDGRPVCELEGTCGDGMGGDTTGGDTAGDTMTGDTTTVTNCMSCTTTATDSDGDCIEDAVETSNGNSDPALADTDGDGILDGCEDNNQDGIRQLTESDPRLTDTDGDTIPDNIEDRNLNGVRDLGESAAYRADSDFDGLADNIEDANQNGMVDPYTDTNGNGCWDVGEPEGETSPNTPDTDGDGLEDIVEDRNGNQICDATESCAFVADSDCDGLSDGAEDLNANGVRNTGEADPRNPDTDGDGLPDGLEDVNLNGRYDPGVETNLLSPDTDQDGIRDGVEDRNKDGIVNLFTDTNGNGCWDEGEPAGESNPRLRDSDSDGLPDGLEDRDQDGVCRTIGTGATYELTETCAWATRITSGVYYGDSDCDYLLDGVEDANLNGSREIGETDPLSKDSDFDGLQDGCAGGAPGLCEDTNNDGFVGANETNPRIFDTDGDGLGDGCERAFDGCADYLSCGLNPLSTDSDGDGETDGNEDANRNCIYEPGAPENETDPRVYDPPPTTGTQQRAEWNVCASQNLKKLSFAESPRIAMDLRVAFEVENTDTGTTCTDITDCNPDEICQFGKCMAGVEYNVLPFGADNDLDGFDPNDVQDDHWGFFFESPSNVFDPALVTTLSREIVGFVYVTTTSETLDNLFDAPSTGLRDTIGANYDSLTELASISERPAHDDTTSFPVTRVQRQWEISSATAKKAFDVNVEIANAVIPSTWDPNTVPGDAPPLAKEYSNFRVNFTAVKRHTLLAKRVNGVLVPASDGDPVVVILGTVRQDDSGDVTIPNAPAKFQEALVRMEDLTGGSAIARFGAETSESCENRPATKATADLLWVIDDSRSMQQIIGRLQQAAVDAKAILTANSEIVDFRTAMTTTNPARGARTLCVDECYDQGTPNDRCAGASCGAGSCGEHLGCIKECPAGCDSSCGGASCCSTSPCECPGSCVTPGTLLTTLDAEVAGSYPLPGGGGQFYWEDSEYLDCDSTSSSGQTRWIQDCSAETEFMPFFNAGSRLTLWDNRGLIGSDAAASCMLDVMDLAADVDLATNNCTTNPEGCCERLLESCTDGPTVLASQMCNLIREMGGLPTATSSGARASSGSEMGTLTARQMLQSMTPALPLDYPGSPGTACPNGMDAECGVGEKCYDRTCYASDGTFEACTPGTCTGNDACINGTCRRYVNKLHFRRPCTAGAMCPVCDPFTDSSCTIVPVLTLMLSDEEDYYFKDECRQNDEVFSYAATTQDVDRRPLTKDCYWIDGDGNTAETCTKAYCEATSWPAATRWSASRSAAFRTGLPAGYDPTQAQTEPDASFSVQWPSLSAAECSNNPVDIDVTCRADPCGSLPGGASCVYPNAGNNLCAEVSGDCMNKCQASVWALAITDPTNVSAGMSACSAEPGCTWRDDLVYSFNGLSYRYACVPERPINDCQACKRLLREEESAVGDATLGGLGIFDVNDPNSLNQGFVYSIVRNLGKPGDSGLSSATEDECQGGSITWGLGDGSAYRAMSIATRGRTQNVCADNYQAFMQTVISDIAALSAPYPLNESPIAATIKVGIARPDGGSGFDYIDVPRSNSQGFIYNATTNSIGFKSDPIDGDCGNLTGGLGECLVDGTFDPTEIQAARERETVPKENDIIYISYRFWRPVPCQDQCAPGEYCARIACPDPDPSPPACTDPSECIDGRTCISMECVYDCSPGEDIDICLPRAECPPCEVFDESAADPNCNIVGDQATCDGTAGCQWNGALLRCDPDYCVTVDPAACAALSTEATCNAQAGCLYNTVNDTCESVYSAGCGCATGGIACNPGSVNTCPAGFACDESCVCTEIAACDAGFNPDGSVTNCTDALNCCQTLRDSLTTCPAVGDQPTCDANPLCEWTTSCEARYADDQCCLSNESFECSLDPETGESFLVCIDNTACACNCNAATQYCDVEAGCVCRTNPI